MKPLFPLLGFAAVSLAAVFWMTDSDEPPAFAQAFEAGAASQAAAPDQDKSLSEGPVFPEQPEGQPQTEPGPDPQPQNDGAPGDQLTEQELTQLNPDYPAMDMRLQEMTARRNGQSFDAEQVQDALREPDAWEPSESPGEGLGLTDEERNDGREFIRLKRLKLETLVAGDTVELPISQSNQTYQAEITQALANSDGSVTWHGKLVDEIGPVTDESGAGYGVTFTAGQRMASGGMFTPEGHFVIEAVDEQGWVANASTLFKFDEDKPDFIVPDDHNH